MFSLNRKNWLFFTIFSNFFHRKNKLIFKLVISKFTVEKLGAFGAFFLKIQNRKIWR
jgi:hypothetical protein